MTASVPDPPASAGAALAPTVPRSWRQALVLARYQLRDYLRSRRFVLMMAIIAASGAIITWALAYFRPAGLLGAPDAFYGGPWAGGVTFVIVIAGIIYGGDAIAGEFQNRTGYFLMGLPLRRASVYAGKFVAAFLASTVAVLFYLVILVGNGVYYLGTGAFSDPLRLLASFGLALLYLLALLGTTFLFSSLFKQSVYAVLVVAVLFLFGWSILQLEVTNLARVEPWFVISYAQQVIGYPLTGAPEHIARGPLGLRVYSPTLLEGIEILVGYFVLTTFAGLVLFEREEFT